VTEGLQLEAAAERSHPGDVGRQTHGGGAAAGCVDAPRRQLVHIRQQLRLGCSRVAHQQYIELATQLAALEALQEIGQEDSGPHRQGT